MNIRPYRFAVPQAVLDDLNYRLANTRWPDQIPDAGWDYGINLPYIKELCEYWRNEYDWRHWEQRFNEYPSFIANVDGVDIRFWHVRSAEKNAFPLLLLHGWPGSAFEFFDMIGPLTNPTAHGGNAEDAFDVVVPDLPGFGFGGHPAERGWGCARIAGALNKLMTECLGYAQYGTQGGDWGSMISARLGALYPENVKAIHLNFPFIAIPMLDELPPEDMEKIRAQEAFDAMEGAYHLIQETKCDSVSLAQTDSPAGLAAWIIEKFRTWSDCDGDIESVYTKDQLITNLMFYWAPNSVASAARIYYESFHNPSLHWGAPNPQIFSKTAVANFPKDPFGRPRSWVEKHYNLVRWTDMPAGGHFPGLEKPELLVADVREFYRTIRVDT